MDIADDRNTFERDDTSVDAMCHLEPTWAPNMDLESIPKLSQIGPEAALKSDSDSKLKRGERENGVHPGSTNWRILKPLGEGNREGKMASHA